MGEDQAAFSIAIDEFFTRCGLVPSTRNDCDVFVQKHFPGRTIAPAQTQGYCSYTLLVDNHIIQFRPSVYQFDPEVLAASKAVYGSYAPQTEYMERLQPSGLLVYKMDKMPGISYKDFRNVEHLQTSIARLTLCEDFAAFLAQSWHAGNRTALGPGTIASSIRRRLEQLSLELPLRFQSTARYILSQMHVIEVLPLVLSHGDIVASNIMLDAFTGHLCGLVDWAEAEILPFGVCLYGLEEILGYMQNGRFVYHTDAEQTRNAFWKRLQIEIPDLTKGFILQAVFLARDLGVLLWHGFAFDDGAINRVVQEGKDDEEICYLDALLMPRKLM